MKVNGILERPNGKCGNLLSDFYKGKKVLITGHTGFKGSWLCVLLKKFGADTYGYSLDVPTNPSLYKIANIDDFVMSEIGDVRDYNHLSNFVSDVKPDIVIHMAAQPIVKIGYLDPRMTYETNVMGTVNILEAVRNNNSVKAFLNVTTDKVYENNEDKEFFKEDDRLNGYDPYSNSKSCSELVTDSYKKSFFKDSNCTISTARAGNVIGGGDFAEFRIIPDCVSSAIKGETIIVRNPSSIRPFQHVLEPLYAYLTIIYHQMKDHTKSGNYNVGPDIDDCVNVEELVNIFCKEWGGVSWKSQSDNGPHEAKVLRLDCSFITERLGYRPKWHIDEAVRKVVEWSKVWQSGGDVLSCMKKQIDDYLGVH